MQVGSMDFSAVFCSSLFNAAYQLQACILAASLHIWLPSAPARASDLLPICRGLSPQLSLISNLRALPVCMLCVCRITQKLLWPL